MKQDKPICYLICGFLGAGKTTYSKKLAQQTNATHLNADELCMKLFKKEEYEKKLGKLLFKNYGTLMETSSHSLQTRTICYF